jgi:hypothetical protein
MLLISCARVWSLLSENDMLDNGSKPQQLLWGLMIMMLYKTEAVMSSLAGGVDEQTFRKWGWFFIEQVSWLSQNLVSNLSN